MPASTCPKCTGTMNEGFLLDESYGTRKPSVWVEGQPEHSFWTGLKLRGKAKLTVRTMRCSRCGFLESYASDAGTIR